MGGWPRKADTPLDRRTTVALAYRRALEEQDPATAARLDEHFVGLGEVWIRPRCALPDDDLLSASEVEAEFGTPAGTVRAAGSRGELPSVLVRGRRRYRVSDVRAWRAARRQARAARGPGGA